MSDEPLVPQQPEYEEITVREVSIGFVGGAQDLTLYPEDELHLDISTGQIQAIYFKTMGQDFQFMPYPGQVQWHSIRHLPHRRVKGTLRPTPEQVIETFKRNREQERRQKLQEAVTDMIRMGTVGSDYNPNE